MEMSVECVYPIPEATTTGLLFIAGQLVGIIMILTYPAISPVISENSYIYTNIQTCISKNSTSNSTSNSLNVVDYQYPVYAQTAFSAIIAIIFTIFFKCPYLRLRTERERLAEEILNSAPDLSN
jgi:FLVCR family MFS transporter 7